MSKTSLDVGKHLGHQAEGNAQPLYIMLQPKGHVVLKKKKKKIPVEDKLTFQNYKMYKEIIRLMQKSMDRRKISQIGLSERSQK